MIYTFPQDAYMTFNGENFGWCIAQSIAIHVFQSTKGKRNKKSAINVSM